jgi:transcriptional regulator GlxA family with amidase domain
MERSPRRVLIIGFQDAELLGVSGPADVLDAANRLGARPRYEIRLASVDGRAIRCESGLTLAAQQR